jgi:hypothetical protein
MQRVVEKLTAENSSGVLATDRVGSASQQWQKWQRQTITKLGGTHGYLARRKFFHSKHE